MSAQESLAGNIEWQASILAFTVANTVADRLTWAPDAGQGGTGRSTYDQVAECVGVNFGAAAILRGEAPPTQGETDPAAALFASSEAAQEQLKASAAALGAAIRGLSDADLDRRFDHPYLGQVRGRILSTLPGFNMIYHVGQINYIQTLYGDTEFRVPPGALD